MGGIGPMWIFGGLVGWFILSHFISGPITSIVCKASGISLMGQTQSRVVRSAYAYGR